MKIDKANTRDKKYRKNRYGMKVSGKSLFVLQAVIIKKSEEAKNG